MAALLAVPAVVSPVVVRASEHATFVVDRPDDVPDLSCEDPSDNDDCSLRSAVALANATTGAVIELPAGAYGLTGGQLRLAKPLVIAGAGGPAGEAASVIDGGGRDRVFEVASTGVTIAGVAITNGAGRLGGGVLVASGTQLTLLDSSVSANGADEGGGIHNAGTLTVSGTAIFGNSARRKGGGILNAGTTDATNVTIHGNSAQGGGGIASSGTATVSYATITANQSTNRNGGGLYRVGGTFVLRGSIVAENLANSADAHDCSGSPNFEGVNLIGNVSGCNPTGTAPVSGNADLGALQDNGGPSHTRALGSSSVAIDAEPDCLVGVDQRGVARPSGPACDLGAFEVEPLTVSLTLEASTDPIEVGAETVPIDGLLAAASEGAAAGEDIASTPLGSIPLASIPLGSIPLRSIPLKSIPLGSIPLASIPLGSIPLASIPLGSILLSDVPLLDPYDWADVFGADVPLQTLTLADAFATLGSTPLGSIPLGSIPLGSIDLSATPLGSIPLVSILLWDTPLKSIPLRSILAGDDTATLEEWCGYLGAELCAELGIDPDDPSSADDVSLVSLALAGIPLGSIPLGSIPLGSIPLGSIPLGSIPLKSIPLGSIPLGSIPLGSIPLASIGTLIDCTAYPQYCDGTAASTPLGSIEPDAFIGTLADLQDAIAPDLLPGNLAELLLALIGGGDVPWEQLDLGAVRLQPIAEPPQPLLTYTARVRVGGSRPADVTVTVDLPDGFTPADPDAVFDAATNTLTLGLDDAGRGTHTLSAQVWAGLQLGPAEATANASATDGTDTVSAGPASAVVEVVEAFEPGAPAVHPTPLGDGVLHLAHVSAPGDLDFYEFTVGADGTTASILLSNLPADYDLVLYGPQLDPLRGEPTERRSLVPDHLLDLAHGDDPLDPEVTADVPQIAPDGLGAGPLALHRVSARRGTADEVIDTGSLRPGSYVVQVSGYNGAAGAAPYALRLRLSAPPNLGTCAAPRFAALHADDPGYEPVSTVPEGVDTLFLLNEQWFRASYPDTAEAAVTALDEFAARTDLGFTGSLVRVDGDDAVRQAYAGWDADRCSPEAANAVVRAIGDLLDSLMASDAFAAVENVVLVGDDLVMPFARVPDGTKLSNERSHAHEFDGANELTAALAGGYVLSDAPYGTPRGIAVDDHELFVPSHAVGRLVETPAEIIALLDSFTAAGGRLDPTTLSALVTGYDFLTDGAERIVDNLTPLTGVPEQLISEAWSRQDLETALAVAPAVASVNAHFDATRLLPAEGNAVHDETDLFDTGDYPVDIVRSLLFSMGCHSGLSVPDLLFAVPVPDWAQTLNGLGDHWFANTGFGYGDTELVALSERLMALFAEGLASGLTAGQATVYARQQYARDLALLSPYDEKILHEATFYGLPMLRVGDAVEEQELEAAGFTAASHEPPDEPALHTDPVTGLPVTPEGFDSGETPLTLAETDGGDYYHVDGRTLQVQHRPVQPLTSVDVTAHDTDGGLHEARGVLVTGLSSEDVLPFEPLYLRPTVDLAEHESPVLAADATFPTRIASVVTNEGLDGPEQELVIVPGQFRATDDPGTGTQRLFHRVDTLVYYAGTVAGGDVPTIVESTGVLANGFAGFDVTVAPGVGGEVVRVYVLFKDVASDGDWTGVDLHLDAASGHWVGGGLSGDAEGVEFIVQAVGAGGQVAWSSAKGSNFQAGVTASPDIGIVLDPTLPESGWYSETVTVTIEDGPDLEYSVNGSPFVPYTGPFDITEDGVHVIVARSGDALAAAVVAIDTTAPVVSASATPAPNGAGWNNTDVTVTITADDGGGIGVASVSYRLDGGDDTPVGGPITVTSEGTTVIEYRAEDLLGNSTDPGSLVVKIDRTAPTVTITAPADGATYVPGTSIGAASYACADDIGGSGIGSCSATIDGSTYTGGALPSSQGSHTFSVTGTDLAGNQTTVSHAYTVAYRICLLYDPGSASPAGAAFPVKLQLCDAAGNNLSDRSIVLTATSIDGTIDPGPNFTGKSNDGYDFRFDNKLKGYIYNLDTTGLPPGAHALQFTVDGAPGYEAPFLLK